MKNRPLFVQIWLVIIGITTGIALLLLAVIPFFLGNYFTREIYSTIEDAQSSLFAGRPQYSIPDRLLDSTPAVERDQAEQNMRTVSHLLLNPDGRFVQNTGSLPAAFKQLLVTQALQQTEKLHRYRYELGDESIFYMIRKANYRGSEVNLISYMWDAHRNKLVQELSNRLFLIMGLVLLFSWAPALWLAKYLSRPLVRLEEHMKRIADRSWNEPIDLHRKDEIGRLAQSMEQTRQQLIRQDEAQQSLLQHISHELKTPVMIIRSYVQSIQDGIFPKGDLETSVEVIDEEAERLERRIRALLYLTKLDYLYTHKPPHETVHLDRIAAGVADRLRWRRPELRWSMELEPFTIKGDRDQWTIALENLLDNQIRYAETQISVRVHPHHTGRESASGFIAISNDGPPLEADVQQQLFEQFRKGHKGEFGLGLTIVKRIAVMHRASITAANKPEGGVEFRLDFP